MNNQTDVIVIGAGFGGLLAACELRRRGRKVLLVEASPYVGGVGASVQDQGFTLEPAAGSILLPSQTLTPILTAAGATVVPASTAARRRYVYERGELFELAGPKSLASRLVSPTAKLRILREPWVKPRIDDAEESLAEFLQRRLGSEVGRLIATLMAHGVCAADPDKLSARAAFPAFVDLEQQAGSMIKGALAKMRGRPKGAVRPSVHIAQDSMASLAKKLAAYLGDDAWTDWAVTSVRPDGDEWVVSGPTEQRAKSVVLAVSPQAAATIAPTPLGELLSEARSAPVAVVGIGGKSVDVPAPAGFGALVGPSTDVRTLGLLFESSYAPHRAPERQHLLKAILGGGADPTVLELNDAELTDLAVKEASQILGTTVQPSWTRVVRHSPGIPQYELGHTAWLERLDRSCPSGLHLAGWSYQGIGLSSLAQHAVQLADLC